jgi:altronate dehydratase large subunit
MVGVCSDWLVEKGGSIILSETTEAIGTDGILAKRAVNEHVAKKLTDLIQAQWETAKQILGHAANLAISPGNMEGGLSSIQEKSLGCIVKGGTTKFTDVLEYAEVPTTKGLMFMDTPGSDIFSLTGMAAGGAQIIIFTTGRGTPAGFPLVPVIKIASNNATYENMFDDMDLNGGKLTEGVPVETAGQELIDLVAKVAQGHMPKAEANDNDLFAIHTLGPSF